MPPKPGAISILVLPILDLLPATVSLILFQSESSGPSGPVPASNNGRISTASGLTVSCFLSGCESWGGGGGCHRAKGSRKVPGNVWGMGLVGQDAWGSGVLAGRQNLLRGEVVVVRKWNLLRAEEGGEDA